MSKLCELLTQVSVKEAGEEDRCCDICTAGGIQKVASHFCAQCSESFCSACQERHAANNLFVNHSVVDLSIKHSSGKLFCKQHAAKPIKYICQECGIFICTVCAINTHNAHNVQDLEVGLSEHNENIKKLKVKIQDKLKEVKATHEQLAEVQVLLKGWQNDLGEKIESSMNATIDRVTACKNELVEMIANKGFNEEDCRDIVWACDSMKDCADNAITQQAIVIINQIKDTRTKLVSDMKEKCETLTVDIAERVEKVSYHIACIESLVTFVHNLLAQNNALEVLMIYDDLTTRVNSVLETEMSSLTSLNLTLTHFRSESGERNLGELYQEEGTIGQFLAKSRLAEAVCTEDEDEEVAEAMGALEGAVGGVAGPSNAIAGSSYSDLSSSTSSIPNGFVSEPESPLRSSKKVKKNLNKSKDDLSVDTKDYRKLRKNNNATRSAVFDSATKADPWLREDAMTRSSSFDSKLKSLAGVTTTASSTDVLDTSKGAKSKGKVNGKKEASSAAATPDVMRSKRPLTPSAPVANDTLRNSTGPPPYSDDEELPNNTFMRTKSLDESTLKQRSTLIKDTVKNCRPRSISENPQSVVPPDFSKAKGTLLWEKEGSMKVHNKKGGLSKRKISSSSSPSSGGLPEIRYPHDVCFLSNGDILISDTIDRNLQVLSTDTVMWSKVKDRRQPFVTSRPVAWQHIEPACVMVAPQLRRDSLNCDGELVVCTDTKDKCVKLIDIRSKGSCVASWGKSWFMPMFKSPSGLAVTDQGKWVITDVGKHCVSIHDPEGRIINQFGSRGKGAYGFEQPKYVTVDHHGRILVSDSGNGGIKVYDKSGQFLFKISSKEVSDLNSPAGLCIDHAGNILCADRQRHCVHMFSADGRFIRQILNHKNGLRYPVGVAIGEHSQLAVTQLDPPAVKVFDCSETE